MTSTREVENNLGFLSYVKYEHLVAGVTAGLTSTLALHPLDVIKIRFAVNDGKSHKTPGYTGIVNAFTTIYKQEGVFGLYRGVTPNLWGAATSWGLYFFFYNSIKSSIQNGNTQTALGPTKHLLAASQAGILTLTVTNPLWVVKTQLCLQNSTTGQKEMYRGMLDALKQIYKKEGLRGYYRGYLPGVFGVSHGAVQFMVYEELKNSYNEYRLRPINVKLGTIEYLIFAAVSKLIAAGLTYPYQVIRARLQNQYNPYNGMWHCIVKTWKFEGWKGYYKGLGTNLLRVTPATMITFLTYENVSHFLVNLNQTK